MGERQSTEVHSKVSKFRKIDSQRNEPSVLENYIESSNKYGNNFQDDVEMLSCVENLDSRCDDDMSDFSGSLSNISLRNLTSDQECSVNWLTVTSNMSYPPSPMSVDAVAGTTFGYLFS